MSNVIYLDDRRRNSKEFRAAVLRHPCMAARREDRKSTRLNSSHIQKSRMPSSA